MNKVMTRKSVLKPQQDADRRVAKKGMKNSQSGKKGKDQKKLKSRTKKMSSIKNHIILQEFAEYESSRQELPTKAPSESPSNSSVVYIQTFRNQENSSVVDLTRSSSTSIALKGPKRCLLTGKSLQTLYKNKTINIVNMKNFSAKSLIAIPVTGNLRDFSPFQLRKVKSAPELEPSRKDKLNALEIPPEFIDESDLSEYNFIDLDKANLDEHDIEMINMVMDIEQDDYQSLLSMSSSDLIKLDGNKSIEDMCVEYGIDGTESLP